MSAWRRYALPPAIVLALVRPGYATEYMSVEAAQKLAFPNATRFVEADVIYRPEDIARIERISGQKVQTKGEQVWRALNGDQPLGHFIVDYVIGKHLVIDYAVALDANGAIIRVEILEYRESYGGEVANADWLGQFIGKTGNDPLVLDQDIRNISGATLSSRHVTDGIKRVLAVYDTRLK
jgi:Na+-translocating ferredoxin:NAD+ oxidoreductase RnfG subunit